MAFSKSQKIQAVIVEALGEFRLADSKLGPVGWAPIQTRFLNFCLEHEVLSFEELREVVASRIRQLGRESYVGHVDAGMPPDHTVSPQALAFAMRMGELTYDEVAKIKFGHGETAETFMEGVEKTLVTDVVRQLRGV